MSDTPSPDTPVDVADDTGKYVVQLPQTGGEYVMDHWVDQVPEQRHLHHSFADALAHLLAAQQEGAAIYHRQDENLQAKHLAKYEAGRITLLEPGIERIRYTEDEARENWREAATLNHFAEEYKQKMESAQGELWRIKADLRRLGGTTT